MQAQMEARRMEAQIDTRAAAAAGGRQGAASLMSLGKEFFGRRERIYPWLYAAGILLGELTVVFNARAGVLVHLLVLGGLLVQTAYLYGKREAAGAAESAAAAEIADGAVPGGAAPAERAASDETASRGAAAGAPVSDETTVREAAARFYLTLTLAPLIRILSLSLPLAIFPIMYWYAVVSLPLLVGAAVVAALNGYGRKDLGLTLGLGRRLNRRSALVQLLIALAGLPLGLAEYFILRPQPLAAAPDPAVIWLPALILLVCTGFTEEFIFRGIMQKAAADFLGWRTALVLVSLIFAALHVTHLSALDVFFVFAVAALFATAVHRTGSLFGVTLAHGLTNITMYLIWPFVF